MQEIDKIRGVQIFFLPQKYKRVVGFRYVKKGCSPTEQRMGSPLGTSAVMVGNTLFDVAVGLTSACLPRHITPIQ